MKNFEDLSITELAALSNEQVDRYCKIHAAQEGVPFPPEVPIEPDTTVPDPDTTIYTVNGISSTSAEHAAQVCGLLNSIRHTLIRENYDWKIGYAHKYADKLLEQEFAVSVSKLYSANNYFALSQKLKAVATAKEEYEKEKKEYEKGTTAYTNVINYTLNKISEARSEIWKRERNQARFDEYLKLAEGDRNRAWIFFEKAGLAISGWRPIGAPPITIADEE